MSDFRLLRGEVSSWRTTPLFLTNRPRSAQAQKGLAYERALKKELDRHVRNGNFVRVEYNPWFGFSDASGSGTCAPDFVIQASFGYIVVEVKLSWVPEAIEKLNALYCPIVANTLQAPVKPLVICRYMAAGAPEPSFSLREGISKPPHLIHWFRTGPLVW